MMPRVGQYTEILWWLENMSIYRDFMSMSMSTNRDFIVPEYVNSQRFYDAPSMSIYTEILWYPE